MLVTLAGVVAWWVSSQFNWIRERRDFVANNPIVLVRDGSTRAPGLLWLFGEEGNSEVLIQVVNPLLYEQARLAWPGEFDDREYFKRIGAEKLEVFESAGNSLIEQAKRLYPEANRVRNTYLKADPREADAAKSK
jgi:hypothetical protein